MTENKPIMIDGVDVSGCKRIISNKIYGYVCNCEEDTHLISSCKHRPDCYFKQLARKTQECEILQQSENEAKEIIAELKAENETYKKMLDNPEVRVALTDIRSGERDLWQKYKPRMEQAEQKLGKIRKIANGIHDMWINKTKYTDVYHLAEHLLKCELNRIINEFDEIDEVE